MEVLSRRSAKFASLILDDWNMADVTTVFKKGTKSDPGTYRPVSLTCVACTLLESFVRHTVVEHSTLMTDNNSLYSKYFRSTECV